jgi:hypothetical protein
VEGSVIRAFRAESNKNAGAPCASAFRFVLAAENLPSEWPIMKKM